MSGEKILIVDDEPEIVELVKLYLEREGFEIFSTGNGLEAAALVTVHQPDLIILDVLLPGMDGIEICRQLRQISQIPILFVSCKSEDIDVILGLGMGGDDYITKPFSPGQLVARVKAHLRRSQLTGNPRIDRDLLKFAGLEVDLSSHLVTAQGKEVQLSAKEFDLLVVLAKAPNRVFRIELLYEMIWDAESMGDTRTLLVHISNLRKKIEPNPADPRYIITVRGVGYKFAAGSAC